MLRSITREVSFVILRIFVESRIRWNIGGPGNPRVNLDGLPNSVCAFYYS